MKKIVVIVSVIIIIIIFWQLYPTEERRLKSDIARLERAVEAEMTDEIMYYIDPLYQDSSGMTHDDINRVITEFFAQVDSIKVQMSGLKINIDSVVEEDLIFASCSLGLRVLARYEGERVLAFGGIVKPSPVRAFFRKTGKHYRIYGTEY